MTPGLRCSMCDEPVPDGAASCGAKTGIDNRGGRWTSRTCGSRAFYRGRKPQRSIMPRAMDDEVPVIAEAPYPARRTMHGHR